MDGFENLHPVVQVFALLCGTIIAVAFIFFLYKIYTD